LLVNGDDKIKEYSKVVNDKIQELEKAKQPADKVEPTIDTEAPTEESK
jgi:hypothetical protein